MTIADHLLRELELEAPTTRRVLERVPAAKLGWKPHAKSMSLGQLAQHVACTPGGIAKSSIPDTFPVEDFKPDPEPSSVEDILRAHEASMTAAKSVLAALDDQKAMASWSMTGGGQALLTMPRVDWLRIYMLNHWYHHRGQLAVYLRELDVPVPAMYGPSADENS
jgi:uncharacterized damage-inducible protein DinB